MKTKFNRDLIESMSKDPNNWKGLFYVNSNDPRVLVPKRYPVLGWTLNLANPYTYIAIGILLIIIVVAGLVFG